MLLSLPEMERLTFPSTATASTNFSGAGNLRSRSTSIAGVDLSITYIYSLADLSISITPPSSIVVGQTATFGIDVSNIGDGEWYQSYVSFAVGNSIIQQKENYRPNEPMLRTELSAMVLRIMRFSNDIRIRAYMTSIDPLLR